MNAMPGVGSGPVSQTSAPIATMPDASADSNMWPDSRVSLPIAIRVWRPGWRSRAAIAMPSRVTVALVIGSRLATPRIPSVPNSVRPLLIVWLVARGRLWRPRRRRWARRFGRRELGVLGRDLDADARGHALDCDLDLTSPRVRRQLRDRDERAACLLDTEQRAGQRDVDLRRRDDPPRRVAVALDRHREPRQLARHELLVDPDLHRYPWVAGDLDAFGRQDLGLGDKALGAALEADLAGAHGGLRRERALAAAQLDRRRLRLDFREPVAGRRSADHRGGRLDELVEPLVEHDVDRARDDRRDDQPRRQVQQVVGDRELAALGVPQVEVDAVDRARIA